VTEGAREQRQELGGMSSRTLLFSASLRDETDLDTLNYELVSVVRKTIQPSHVSLWLRTATPVKAKQEDQPTI
jgi:hypothetical protein